MPQGGHDAFRSLHLNSRVILRSLSFCRRSDGGSFRGPHFPPMVPVCDNGLFPLRTLTGENERIRGLTGWTTALDWEISSERLACCGRGTCHGFQSTVGSATTGNQDTQRTWTSLVYSSNFATVYDAALFDLKSP